MNEQITPVETLTFETPRQLCWVRFSHDGQVLLGGGYDGLIRRWKFPNDKLSEHSPIDGFHGWTQAFALHPVEPLVFAADSWGRIACHDYSQESSVAKWELPTAHDGWIRSLCITPDGTRLVSAGNDCHARVFDTANGALLQEIPVSNDDIFAVAIHPAGKSIVTGDLFCRLKAWDLETGQCRREFDAEKLHFYDRDQDVCGLRILQFRDAGRTLLAAGAEPTQAGRGHGIPVIYLFDWETGSLTRRFEQGDANDGFIEDLVTHEDGFVMTVTTGQPGKGKLILQNLNEDKPFLTYTKISNTHAIALTPDGKQFVVAATNRNSQGNGAVKDKDGMYSGNFSPLHLFRFG